MKKYFKEELIKSKKRPVAFKLNDKELINLMRERSNIYSKSIIQN